MNFSITGIILTVLFIIPGAIFTDKSAKHLSAPKLSTTEKILYSIEFSIWLNTCLTSAILIFFWILQKNKLFNLNFLFLDLAFFKHPDTLGHFFIIWLILCIYFIFCCFLAESIGEKYWENKKNTKNPKEIPIWLNFFNLEENYVKITMNDNSIYWGEVAHYPTNYEILTSGDINIVLTGVEYTMACADGIDAANELPRHVTHREGYTDLVMLNTKNIKTIELVRTERNPTRKNQKVIKHTPPKYILFDFLHNFLHDQNKKH